MDVVNILVLGILVPLVFGINVGAVDKTGLPPCDFPAIYNFGDSNSDTGGLQAVYKALSTSGKSFFGNYTGRFSDGRLLLDFMAENLSLPYVSAYLNSIGTNFRHGANFGTSGASIRPQRPGGNPFDLDIQTVQFDQLKARTSDLYNQAKNTSRIPKPEDFSKALYTIDIGQNDLTVSLDKGLDVRAQIPDMVNQFTTAVKHLYQQGARTFWIHNAAPLGCYPFVELMKLTKWSFPRTKDKKNCYEFLNEMSMEFNSQLKDRVNKLRVELPEAALTYVDLYTPVYELFTNYKNLGFKDICCGTGNVTVDYAHRTEAANLWLADRVLNGSLSDPPIPITYACHKQVGS